MQPFQHGSPACRPHGHAMRSTYSKQQTLLVDDLVNPVCCSQPAACWDCSCSRRVSAMAEGGGGLFSSYRSKHKSESGNWEKDSDHPNCGECGAPVRPASALSRGLARSSAALHLALCTTVHLHSAETPLPAVWAHLLRQVLR